MKNWYWWVFSVIMLGSLGLRIWYSTGHVSFNYDQARDALIAREIRGGDIKIMGPSASGTQDSVYHGVLFYYVIALLYAIAHGDPQVVAYSLAALSTLGLIPVFLFARQYFQSPKPALLITTFTGFSLMTVSYSAWISEHIMGLVFLPWYVYFSYQLFEKYSLKKLLIVCFFLGLLEQSAVFNLYWGLPLLLILINSIKTKAAVVRTIIQDALLGALVFFSVISTMILTQVVMYSRGIFSLDSLAKFTAKGTQPILEKLAYVFREHVLDTVQLILLPGLTNLLSFALILTAIYLLVRFGKTHFGRKWEFPLYFLAAPFALLLAYGTASEIWVGFDSIVYIVMVAGFYSFYKNFHERKPKVIDAVSLLLLCTFIGMHTQALVEQKRQKDDFWRLPVQVGFNLSDQLSLIYVTYAQADHKMFSVDSLTDPYGINVVWAYLYMWYGQNEYGYTPVFTGPSQAGYLSENILSEDKTKLAEDSKHFVMVEPESTIGESVLDVFNHRQTEFGYRSQILSFETLELQVYHPSSN